MRRWITLFALLSALITSFAAPANATAAAAPRAGDNCGWDSKPKARSMAASGRFIEPVSVNLEMTTKAVIGPGIKWPGGTLTLRYSTVDNCAWALVTDALTLPFGGSNIWIERAATYCIQKQRKTAEQCAVQGIPQSPWVNGNGTSYFTGAYSMMDYLAIRACGVVEVIDYTSPPGARTPPSAQSGPTRCTNWVYPSRLCCQQHAGGPEFDRLTSPNGKYIAVMQGDGTFVQYEFATGRVMWARHSSPGTILRMQSDGNLVLYAPGNVATWSSGTAGRGGPVTFVQLQDDGNLVIYGNAGATWASHAR